MKEFGGDHCTEEKKIQQDTSATMIVASHDPLVERYATQVIGIKDGRVSEVGANGTRTVATQGGEE